MTQDAREEVMARALRDLADAPDHREHRHGLVVGTARDPLGRPAPVLVVAVQGLRVPVWVSLDVDDIEAVRDIAQTMAAEAREPADAPPVQ